MKYIKLISILTLATLMFSCSDDDKGNSADVKVGFAAAEQDFSYSDFIYIPVKVEGVQNGDINIQIAVKEYTGNFAVTEDVDYMITSKNLVIKKGMTEVEIEVKIINKPDEARFTLELTHANHANFNEATQTTLISIAKTDFDRLTGVYDFAGTDPKTGAGISFPLAVSTAKANEEFNVSGWNSEDDAFSMEFDEATQQVIIPSINVMAAYNFNGIGAHYIALCTYDKVSKQITADPLIGTWNETFTEITLDQSYGLVVALFTYPDGNPTNYIYGPRVEDFTMIRPANTQGASINLSNLKIDSGLIQEVPEMFQSLKAQMKKINVSDKVKLIP